VPQPRVTTVMGVARVVLATVPATTAAEVLVDEFGFDATFQALALLPRREAGEAFGHVWTALLTDPFADDLARTDVPRGDDGRVPG
jgi:hypothetical protein